MADANLQEIETLTHALCEGSITAADHARLDALVTSGPAARDAYIRYMNLHAVLGQSQSTTEPWTPPVEKKEPLEGKDQEAGDRSQQTEDRVSSHVPPRKKSLLNRASAHPLWPSITVAMLVMVIGLGAAAVTYVSVRVAGNGGKNNKDERSNPVNEAEFVAKLSNWNNAVWLDDTRPPKRNPELKIGKRLAIESGLIEVTYLTGTRVVIEGPAEFVVLGKKRCALDVGKLVGHCDDEKAKGFVVETSGIEVEDLGTEFAVDVNGHGFAYVEVFDGKVSVADRATPPRFESAELGAESALVVNLAEDGAVATIRRTTPDGRGFARAMPRKVPVVELLAHYTFDEQSTANSADEANHLTAHGEPKFVATQIEGLGDAIDLDGVDDYAICETAVHPLGNDSYTWAVWVRFDELPKPPTRNSNLIQWGVAQPDGGTFVGLNCTQERPLVRVNHVSLDTDRTTNYTPTRGQYLHLAGTRKGLRERFYVNGQLQDAIRYNSVTRTARGPIVVGCIHAERLTEHSKAQVADVQIYKGFVDDQQVEYLYKHPGSELSSAQQQEDE